MAICLGDASDPCPYPGCCPGLATTSWTCGPFAGLDFCSDSAFSSGGRRTCHRCGPGCDADCSACASPGRGSASENGRATGGSASATTQGSLRSAFGAATACATRTKRRAEEIWDLEASWGRRCSSEEEECGDLLGPKCLMPASPAESCLYEILVGRTVLARVLAASAAVSFRQSVPTRCRLECRGCCPRPPLGAQAESLEAFAPAVAAAECAAPMACEDAEPLLPCRRCSVPRSCL